MAKANKSSRSTKGAKTAKHTKKNLGKRNNRTRRHRKGTKKGKHVKKGGFLNYNTPLTTFDYASRVSDEEVRDFVETFFLTNTVVERTLKYTNLQGNCTDQPFRRYDDDKTSFNEILKIYEERGIYNWCGTNPMQGRLKYITLRAIGKPRFESN